jgi:hypothetical protein
VCDFRKGVRGRGRGGGWGWRRVSYRGAEVGLTACRVALSDCAQAAVVAAFSVPALDRQ